MTNLPSNLAVIPQFEPGNNPNNTPAYVSGGALTQDAAQQFTVPTGATKVRLVGTADFYAAFGDNPTAVVPSAIVDDGTSNELFKQNGGAEWRTCQSTKKISVISHASACVVTLSFYTN
jgi:hypothetical protein